MCGSVRESSLGLAAARTRAGGTVAGVGGLAALVDVPLVDVAVAELLAALRARLGVRLVVSARGRERT
jgi:hypothetical protein